MPLASTPAAAREGGAQGGPALALLERLPHMETRIPTLYTSVRDDNHSKLPHELRAGHVPCRLLMPEGDLVLCIVHQAH